MKKMFGENGWLGQSPNEKIEIKSPKKKLFPLGNGDLQGRKKTTMMGKLKNKLEEIVRKPIHMTWFHKLTHSRPKKQT